MASYTGTAIYYDSLIAKSNQEIDFANDQFVTLLTTSLYTPDRALHDYLDDISNEVSGNGYARFVHTASWVLSGGANGQMKFDLDDAVFSAVGGSITARYWVTFDNSPALDSAKPLLGYGLIDNTDQDVVTTDGNSLTLTINPNGFILVG